MSNYLKFTEFAIVFDEIPNEVTLAINISGCPNHCPDCHSKYLWDNIGDNLTEEIISKLINENYGITCIAFMGGDNNTDALYKLLKFVKENFNNIKTAWYSGRTELLCLDVLDYIKIGPYIKEYGPLNNKNTNQKMFTVYNGKILENITYKFFH